jgi:phosphoribosylanthranilate isomerase
MDIKICGLTNQDDAACAIEAGADYLGFVIYHLSPRGIALDAFARIRQALETAVPLVAVMVNPTCVEACRAVEFGGASIVQVHGSVDRAALGDFQYPLWRAVAAGADGVCPDPATWAAERYVVDAAVPGLHGGTGQLADWEAAGRLARLHPVMLAGGLSDDLVGPAIRTVAPLGVDVASGVEASPGKKDHAKVRAFCAAVRAAVA